MSKKLLKNVNAIVNNPFDIDDVTAGCENEFQVAVEGSIENVDLPDRIINSKYYHNLVRRVKAGDSPSKLLRDLESLLLSNESNLWENSWVRIEEDRLTEEAKKAFKRDLLKDKENPSIGFRGDIKDFFFYKNNKTYIRIPVSYLLKIVLIDFYNSTYNTEAYCKDELIDFISRSFINDNTSPEVTSFYISDNVSDFGYDVAKENAKRFLFIQLLIYYANCKFCLSEDNQKVYLYNSPITPIKQKKINALVPDELYRDLFISPCLSGWNRGEEKKTYMYLCHSVLSKSKLNTLKKLKDGGFIKSNLVVIPDTSNTCLANNGTHISIGSKRITNLLANNLSEFNHLHEKYYGDLVIKIIEHFLPLFPGTYSAAPYRIPYKDFHPEVLTGFLAHELDFTHLRMIWRRWQKKAGIVKFNRIISPTGLDIIDDWISKIFRMKGDYVNDYRLIDYFVALMSTDNAPALNGEYDNHEVLKEELESLGIFHRDMAFYSLYRLRNYAKYGFSGFEGRYYSNFESLFGDLKNAINLQILITALAYKYVVKKEVVHSDIPDTPITESERRQIFFCSAIGIPTFYVRIHTENNLLKRIIGYTNNSRLSKRYPGYIRVYLDEYLKALVKIIEVDAKELLSIDSYSSALKDCKERIYDEELKTHRKFAKEIVEHYKKTNFLDIPAEDFNKQLEFYYRTELRDKTIKEGASALIEDIDKVDFSNLPGEYKKAINPENIKSIINDFTIKLLADQLNLKELSLFLSVMLLEIEGQLKYRNNNNTIVEERYGTSVY